MFLSLWLGLVLSGGVVLAFNQRSRRAGLACRVRSALDMKLKPSECSFIVCPGFGNDEQDYRNPLNLGAELSFVETLRSECVENVDVLPIKRSDWLKLLPAAASNPFAFAKGDIRPDQLYQFYIQELRMMVNDKVSSSPNTPVVLIGHSAGGWLARDYMADGSTLPLEVVGLVTLGTPHSSPETGKVSDDATRGALRFVDENYPGAFLQSSGVVYVSVGGTAVPANETAVKGDPAFFANDAYLAVSGVKVDQRKGDGVVPLAYTLLQGSTKVVIEGAYHSIQAPNNFWYGGPRGVKKWLPVALKEISSSKRFNTLNSQVKEYGVNGGEMGAATGSIGYSGGLGPWLKDKVGQSGMRLIGVLGILNYAVFVGKFLLGER